MAKIKLRIIETKILEIDTSEVVPGAIPMSKKEGIQFIKDMFKFEDDKTEMNQMIKEFKIKYDSNPKNGPEK